MANNRYIYLDNGTFENYNSNVENVYSNTQVIATMQRSTTFKRTGLASGKLTFKAFKSNPAFFGPNLYFQLFTPGSTSARNVLGVFGNPAGHQFASPDIGRTFLFEMWIYTPSGNPIGSDDLNIHFGTPFYKNLNFQNGNNGVPVAELVSKTVAQCKDTWVKISYKVVLGQGGNLEGFSIYADDSSLRTADVPPYYAPTFAGTLNPDGVLYIDDFTITDITLDTCDLTYGVPAYVKTDETAVDANDGSITVSAGSSRAIQYSMDNVTFQNSELFSPLPPGLYNIYVKDLNGCTLPPLMNIPILEFLPTPPDPPDPPVPGEGVLAIDLVPINSNNFISWFNATGASDYSSMSFINCVNPKDLPKGYRVNKVKGKHYPFILNDEQFSFYINFDKDFSYPNFSSLRLDLITHSGEVQLAIAPLKRVFQADGFNYFIYADVVLTGKPLGSYRLAIIDTSIDDLDVKFVSQEIKIASADFALKHTARFRFRCTDSIYRFLYTDIPDFLQQFRLMVNQMEEQPDGTVVQYRANSTGILRNTSFDIDRYVILEAYFFDDLANRAMIAFCAHDTMILNDMPYILKELYKVTWDQMMNINKGTVQLYDQTFSSINRYGNPLATAPEDPAALLGDNGDAILI